MTLNQPPSNLAYKQLALAVGLAAAAPLAMADAVTDWNHYATLATKGATSGTSGDKSIALNSNVATRIDAIAARAVFDAVNALEKFSKDSYYSSATPVVAPSANSASAAAAQAAHDVLLGALPATDAWSNTRNWLDAQLASDLAALAVNPAVDPGVAAGKSAAAAALAARNADNAAIRTGYIPTSNISPTGTANVTGNPGIGLWRPSNGGAGLVDVNTGAPTGFDAVGNAVAAAAIDFNWKNVTPFSLTTRNKQELAAAVPPALIVGSPEYQAELDFVKTHGRDFAHPESRTDDQLLQALYYKADAELFVNEIARVGSKARGYSLIQNARLFAALDSAVADARIAAFQSKYDLDFWRPITALNADAKGATANFDTWKPLATTPSHPSNTGGHSTTVAAGVEILRAFFKSDKILPNGAAVDLTIFPWLVGTNNGTGKLAAPIHGKDATTRSVTSLSQVQLENGRSRVYLGVHFGNDDFQGQSLGLAVADQILHDQNDPAVKDVSVYQVAQSNGQPIANARNLYDVFVSNSNLSGFYGLQDLDDDGEHRHAQH